MTRGSIVPFEACHAAAMHVQASQKLDWHDQQAMARRYADSGEAFTIRDGAGRVLFCGGAVELQPVVDGQFGHAQMWALFAEAKGMAMPRVLRATREFIARLPHGRVDTPVIDRPEATRWAEMLGLEFDVRLTGAAPLGGDLLMYRRPAREAS